MPQRDQEGRRGDGGFTLVELLSTIVVMGILVGIVVMGVSQFRGDSGESACEADNKIVASAASAYELEQGTYPGDLRDLKDGGYVKDPPSGVTYTFDSTKKTVKQESCSL